MKHKRGLKPEGIEIVVLMKYKRALKPEGIELVLLHKRRMMIKKLGNQELKYTNVDRLVLYGSTSEREKMVK